MFVIHQQASNYNLGTSALCKNPISLGTRLASITAWIGGILGIDKSFLIPTTPKKTVNILSE
jgi:hypothetical protein